MPKQLSMRQDVAIIIGITAAAGWLATYFEFSERVFSFTRRFEHLQLDEWPMVALVLALCLIWISWRRYRYAVAALRAREQAEAELTIVLAKNRELARQQLHALEAERRHLARELHDELGQYLNVIKLDALALTGGDHAASQPRHTQRLLGTISQVQGVVNDMIRRLRPAGLDELGLAAAVESCVDQWRERLPEIRFSFAARGNLDGFPEQVNLTIYRLVQEGLTNSFKHAQAHNIELVLERSGHEVILTLHDDGVGTNLGDRRSGAGLNGMRERVELLGGHLTIDSAPDRGFMLEARIPAEGRP